MNRKLMKIVLPLLIMVIFTQNVAMATNLSDLNQSIYKSEIEKLVEDGIINGYEDGTFRPKSNITRAEFAKVLALSLKLESPSQDVTQFEDVKGMWHEEYVGLVFQQGLMIGKSDTSFSPNSNITREELAVILVRAFDMVNIAEQADIEPIFSDQESISDWAKDAVAFTNHIGLLEGVSKEEVLFCLPKDLVDRQLVAKVTYELSENKPTYEKRIEELITTVDPIEGANTIGTVDPTKPVEPTKPGVSLDNILSKYTSQLNSLQSVVLSELDALVAQAKSEYNAGGSLWDLYEKYQAQARKLESSTDEEVSSILSQLEQDLKDNGHDTNSVSELNRKYEDMKKDYESKIKL